MNSQYTIDSKLNCVFIHESGDYDMHDAGQLWGKLFDDPGFHPPVNILWDMRQCDISDEIDFTVISTKMREGIRPIDKLLRACRIALVMKNGHCYAKAHQFTVALRFEDTAVERKVFREITPALQWLDVPENFKPTY